MNHNPNPDGKIPYLVVNPNTHASSQEAGHKTKPFKPDANNWKPYYFTDKHEDSISIPNGPIISTQSTKSLDLEGTEGLQALFQKENTNFPPDKFDAVCMKSLKLLCINSVKAKSIWGVSVSKVIAEEAILSRRLNLKLNDFGKKAWKALENEHSGQQVTPKFLYMLYLIITMDRLLIWNSITNKEAQVMSGSRWTFRSLISLSCVPLFGVELDTIIPNYKDTQEKVIKLINDCYIVKRILNEIMVASKEDLYLYSNGRHMSWFLPNPWCLFFISLRDLLTRGTAEVDEADKEFSRLNESKLAEEDKYETSSEQLLHRFMEVVLLLFSTICDGQDEFRSTPGRIESTITIASKECSILDDGYVYASRGGTTGHTKYSQKKDLGRSRYSKVPIIRYEAKRLNHTSEVTAQIFAELLSAAVENMNYFNTTVPLANGNILYEKPSYHDAFVIHIHHYNLTIHTARFPTDYLLWVTENNDEGICSKPYCILYKVSASYDLSEPKRRLEAARDILVLLWAIKNGDSEGSKLFVARAVRKQKIDEIAKIGTKPTTSKQKPTLYERFIKQVHGSSEESLNKNKKPYFTVVSPKVVDTNVDTNVEGKMEEEMSKN